MARGTDTKEADGSTATPFIAETERMDRRQYGSAVIASNSG